MRTVYNHSGHIVVRVKECDWECRTTPKNRERDAVRVRLFDDFADHK